MSQLQVEIPDRAFFRASQVCDIAGLQPFILRCWEAEFADLGVTPGNGGQRVYRREDVERVLQIKHLLFVEGLTLAGARRRLEQGSAPEEVRLPPFLDERAREQIAKIKAELRALLEMLNAERAMAADGATSSESAPAASDAVPAGDTAPPRDGEAKIERRAARPKRTARRVEMVD
jgi:DNA-binding transcriptional MerR regulator